MRLNLPVDLQILREMADGRRQTAKNLSAILDRDNNYVNNRVVQLEGDGLLERVGPAENSGLYEITEVGHRALRYQDKYEHGIGFEFGQFVKGELSLEEFESRVGDD
ncbi:Transcriptional regulator, MarR family [Halanaeroarchaeum sp. HSR-CO]|uniref:helix-turn-helix domain-containing protein n=1 Tax=Halanaeroarchaeum sp. HSR-CO TaxID=2866382 RepID=UPI00217DCAE3|nr:helix-turn-helix domain-containing protein [Halanaeroarchaeum sp. HSR-CO]UWG47031.1 Transcriptional regulator, MarR family [Halanaeroarchaeum sp. HSR-CO]